MSATSLRISRLTDVQNDQTPLVFLHGFMGSSADWSFISKSVDRPTFAIDLPGHGLDPVVCSSESWFEETSFLLFQALDALHVSRVIWVGYSLGGRVAMDFASRYPHRSAGLVLESSHPGLSDPDQRTERLLHDRSWSAKIEARWPHMLTEWYQQPVFQLPEDLTKRLVAVRTNNDPAMLAAALNGFSLGHQQPFSGKPAHLNGQTMPILYVAGQKDEKYREVGMRMEAVFPRLVLKVFEGVGHNVHLERPTQYLDTITQFLKSDLF